MENKALCSNFFWKNKNELIFFLSFSPKKKAIYKIYYYCYYNFIQLNYLNILFIINKLNISILIYCIFHTLLANFILRRLFDF